MKMCGLLLIPFVFFSPMVEQYTYSFWPCLAASLALSAATATAIAACSPQPVVWMTCFPALLAEAAAYAAWIAACT